MQFDAGVDRHGRARHDGQVGPDYVRVGALRERHRRLDASAERLRQVQHRYLLLGGRNDRAEEVADEERVVLGDGVAVPVVEVEDLVADDALLCRAPPVLPHVQVVVQRRRRVPGDQLVVHCVGEQVPIDGDVLQAHDAERVAAGTAGRRRRCRRVVHKLLVAFEVVIRDGCLHPARVRRVALHVQLHHVPARVLHDLVVVDVDVLLRARHRDAALQTGICPERVAGDRRVAVEPVDAELEASVLLEDRVVDVDAVVQQLLVGQVDER